MQNLEQGGGERVTRCLPRRQQVANLGNFQQLSTEIPHPGNPQGAVGGMGGHRGSWTPSYSLVASLGTPIIQGLPGFHLLP